MSSSGGSSRLGLNPRLLFPLHCRWILGRPTCLYTLDWIDSLRRNMIQWKCKALNLEDYFQEIPWQSSDEDSMLTLLRASVQSLVGEIRFSKLPGVGGWDGWIASLTPWTWIWANSGRCWRTQEPGMLHGVMKSWIQLSYWTTAKLFLNTIHKNLTQNHSYA